MNKFKIILFSMVCFSSMAHADFVVVNDTNQDAVAGIGYACSSILGRSGTLYHHSEMTFNNDVTAKVCGKKCTVDLYMSNSCWSGKAGSVIVDTVSNTFSVSATTGTKFTLTAEGNRLVVSEKAHGLMNWLKSIFS